MGQPHWIGRILVTLEDIYETFASDDVYSSCFCVEEEVVGVAYAEDLGEDMAGGSLVLDEARWLAGGDEEA